MKKLIFSSVLVAGFVAMTTPAPAIDNFTYDKLTYLTFSQSVQVPGAILGPGTYRFRLANPAGDRRVLQVLSKDGTIAYSMFHTIPDSRAVRTDHSVVTFMETPAGVPAAAKSLFYGGEYHGYQFVYPKGEPNMTSPVERQAEIMYTPNAQAAAPGAVTTAPAAREPFTATAPPPAAALAAGEAAQAPAPAELPRTASRLPLVGFGGLTSLLAGLGLGLLRRHA